MRHPWCFTSHMWVALHRESQALGQPLALSQMSTAVLIKTATVTITFSQLASYSADQSSATSSRLVSQPTHYCSCLISLCVMSDGSGGDLICWSGSHVSIRCLPCITDKTREAEHCLLRVQLYFSLFYQTVLGIWNNGVHVFVWLWHNQAYGGLMRVCQVSSWEHLLVPEVLWFHLVFHFVLEQSEKVDIL